MNYLVKCGIWLLLLYSRRKELDYEDNTGYKKTITDHIELIMEINDLVELSRKEFLVISSNRLLNRLLNNNDFMSKLLIGLKRGITIKLLTDDTNEHILKQIDELIIASKYNQIKFGFSNKLGDINEMGIIADSKIMLGIKDDAIHGTSALLSREEQSVLVQEILFEKYWNEIQSLEIAPSNGFRNNYQRELQKSGKRRKALVFRTIIG